MPEIIIRYLTIVINHFRARWRVHFGMLSFLLNFESPSSLPCACSRRFFSVILLFLSLFFFFWFRSKRIACCLRVVGSIRSLKRGHVFEGMWFVLFEGIFIRNNYVGSGFQAEWFFARFILFFYRLFLFFFFYLLVPLRATPL